MVAIAAATPPTSPARSAPPASAASSAKPAAPTADSAAVVDLSDRAKAVLDNARADRAAADSIGRTFDEILAKRTDALSARLAPIFDRMNIPAEYATHLKVDRFGNVSSEGPWKAKIDKMFSDFPDLAKELKEVSGLSSLKAAQASLDLYHAQKKSTMNAERQAKARTDYDLRAINIQTLSGVMTMKDGHLRSAAVDYVDMLADPNGIASGESGEALKDRLA